jgi:hypothetical protein
MFAPLFDIRMSTFLPHELWFRAMVDAETQQAEVQRRFRIISVLKNSRMKYRSSFMLNYENPSCKNTALCIQLCCSDVDSHPLGSAIFAGGMGWWSSMRLGFIMLGHR